MPTSVVRVTEINSEERDDILAGRPPKRLDLGGAHSERAAAVEERFEALRSLIRRDNRNRLFLLTWNGSKVPRSAVVAGETIAWTQNGLVVADGGKHIGTYDRIIEFGGPTGDQQQMLVYVPRQ